MVQSCGATGDHFDMSGVACEKGHHLVGSGLYGEAWPCVFDEFWTGPGKLWFGCLDQFRSGLLLGKALSALQGFANTLL